MAVMISKDKKEMVVTCKCGCDEAVHLKISHKNGEDYYAYQCFMNGNFHKEQYRMFGVLKKKIKKIWTIIRNKDYYYSDVIMDEEDFKQFKEYINRF